MDGVFIDHGKLCKGKMKIINYRVRKDAPIIGLKEGMIFSPQDDAFQYECSGYRTKFDRRFLIGNPELFERVEEDE